MKKMVGKVSLMLAVLIAVLGMFPGFASAETVRQGHNGDVQNRGGRGGSAVVISEAQQAVIDAAKSRFQILSYFDEETKTGLEYALFIPDGYDASNKYPLIMYIPDSSASGKSAEQILAGYFGSDIWASAEEQAKHPCFVFVPAFSETVVDDNWNTSAQINTAVKVLSFLQKTYSIDADRLYTTGQSMGCMTSLYLNSLYPDLFAASLFVSGQWDINVLAPLKSTKFFYITCSGDTKASGGQAEVMAMLNTDGIAFSFIPDMDPGASAKDKTSRISGMLADGNDANFIRFTGLDHMSSFNYAYDLETVREWLFEQSR